MTEVYCASWTTTPPAWRLRVRLAVEGGPPVDDEYLYRVVDALDAVAAETGRSFPQVALNWLLQPRERSRALPGEGRTRRGFPSRWPTVASVIIGARDEAQLRDNLGAVGWNLTAAQVARLDAASATTPIYPYWHQWQFKERNPPPVG